MIISAIVFENITEFIGRFHPVLVHLPIGVLLIAALFQWLSRKEKYKSLSTAVSIALFWGMVSAIFACISGYLLSNSGDYDGDLISNHQWFGIAVAGVSILAYGLNKRNKDNIWVSGLMVLLIIITGHLGGSITHGSDYLFKAFSSDNSNSVSAKRVPIPDINEALAYNDVIRPILTAKCYKCHGSEKQKGKLRLDMPDLILKGGKGGLVLVGGRVDDSELIKRIFLSKDNEDHMPPLEQPQLTKAEMELLHWWVSSGANFNKKVNALVQPDKIKPVLLALQSEEVKEELKISDVPAESVEIADQGTVKKIQERGIAITAVAQNSNYLSANFVAVEALTEKDLQLLDPIAKQLVWLKLGDSKLNDKMLTSISDLSALTRLSLERTAITDQGIGQLKNLGKLQYLNLIGTKVSAKGLEQLKGLKELRQIFLFQTLIQPSEADQLKKLFPNAKIDFGGYKLQFLESDTSKLKDPKLK
ncbi:c-type cytochrome domain-containing protein [Daejeonella sp.]|jgi:uncharacterized membrane protein|uniref:c-type cytochrome domain-containing protein n=1 Tax=Daejeonella sp. TaxID=2805397 RepID=UPI003784AFFF